MTLQEKIFYARCITANRFRFSYGRKPKGVRLKTIPLAEFPSGWTGDVPRLEDNRLTRLARLDCTPPVLEPEAVGARLVTLHSLFDFRNGHGLDLSSLERVAEGGIRFVSRMKRNNAVSACVKPIEGLKPYAAGQITCALNGEGGVLYSFLQDEPFYTAYHIAILQPKQPMTAEELLFYCACIRANRFRYSYGRQANRTVRSIEVPSRARIPAWVYGAMKRTVGALDIGPHRDTRFQH